MTSTKARIRLFGAERFVPQVPLGAEVMGVIEHRMQIGALVRVTDGVYWQVNGDIVQTLNASMVERGLRAARPVDGRQRERPAAQKPNIATAPVVTVRRRRAFSKPAAPVEP